MKRRLIFLFLLGGLVLLGAYVFFDSEQGWTTISESNGHRYRIQYYENDSARIDWYLNNYQPELNLNMRILERPTAPGSYTKEEIAGQGSASFLMVCRTWGSAENSQKFLIKRAYYKVDIRLNKKMEVDTKKSSMTYWKTKEEAKDDPPID